MTWKQRRGYATQALRATLLEAKAEGLRFVEITTDPDNVPSRHVIERNGGVLSGEAISEKTGKPIKQYWIGTSW